MKRWHGVVVMGWMLGCVANSKEIGATVTDTDSGSGGSGESEGTDTTTTAGSMSGSTTTVGPETSTSEGTDTTSGSEDTTTVGPETTGGLESCEEAQNEAQCDGFPDDSFFTCGWVPTVVVAGGGCEVVPGTGFEGSCVQTGQDDTCSNIEDSSCPDGGTLVYFRVLGLEIGAIELVAFETGVCTEATEGFEPCVMIDDGENVSYDPPECSCLCPE